tara:strand:- start:2014 stop:2544 length:531 start_codon:yes stop_codon:yes gene_type:complete
MKLKTPVIAIFILLGCTFISNAQSQIDNLVKDWERAKAYSLEYLETMPADKFDFKATPKVRSFAQQMLHLTDANYGFTAAATGIESPIGMGESEKSTDTSKENVTKLVIAGYDFVISGLKALNDEQLSEPVTLFGRFEMTKGQALSKLFEHQTHHRGQTTIYLRLAGVTPPNEKLF